MCGFLCVMFDYYYLDFLQAKKSGKTSWFSVTLLPMEGFPLKEIIHPLASPVICPPWSYPYSRWLSSNNIKQSMHFWCSQVTSGSFVIGKSLFCFIDSSTFFLVVRDMVWMHFHHFIAFSCCKLCKDMCSHIIIFWRYMFPFEKHTHTHNIYIYIYIYTYFLMVITQWCLINEDQTPFLMIETSFCPDIFNETTFLW